MIAFEDRVREVSEYFAGPRFKGIIRLYTPRQVVEQRGTLGTDYVDAARSRGVSEFRLVSKHAYRPALIPIITVIGLQIALLLGGAVLTETTFEWKGLGFMLSEFLKARDFVAVQGIVALLAVIVALSNFIVDIIAAIIDPRVRY